MIHRVILALLSATVLGVAACGGSGEPGASVLTVYSGREEEIVEPLFADFEAATGIDVQARYGDSAELAAALLEEGGNSPADVFFAQDAGALGAAAERGVLTALPPEILELVDARFRDGDGRWVGVSGRARVVAYNTEALSEAELPTDVFGFLDPRWRGRLGIAPTNGSFQAFVSALRASVGDERAREWLEGIRDNEPRLYEKNLQIVEAIARGEVDAGLVNHYYLALLKAEDPDAPVANHFLQAGDPGALVNVAGVGIVEGAEHGDAAARFVAFLLSEEGQRFYREEAEETEYPLVAGVPGPDGLPPLSELQGPEISLGDLGAELPATLELLAEVGLT